MTLTTIGYGDIVPVTVAGKILASIMGIISFGIVALPAGLLASGFNNALLRRRSRYEKVADTVIEDGVITDEERRLLRQTKTELGISSGDAQRILEDSRQRLLEKSALTAMLDLKQQLDSLANQQCPHCGKNIGDHEKPPEK